jgi:hypothetical protein
VLRRTVASSIFLGIFSLMIPPRIPLPAMGHRSDPWLVFPARA